MKQLSLVLTCLLLIESCSYFPDKNVEVQVSKIENSNKICIESYWKNSEGLKLLDSLLSSEKIENKAIHEYINKWYKKLTVDEIISANDLLALEDFNYNYFITPDIASCNYVHDSEMNMRILKEKKIDLDIFKSNSTIFYLSLFRFREQYLNFIERGISRTPPHLLLDIDRSYKFNYSDSTLLMNFFYDYIGNNGNNLEVIQLKGIPPRE